MYFLKYLLVFSSYLFSISYGIDPLVSTKVGLIRGLRATDGDYSMFMGIPYATVDAKNPFGPSVPHPVFEQPFDAYDDTAICVQIDKRTDPNPIGDLDCLHLNVYVPQSATSSNKLPVMVWIHGGAFITGSSGRKRCGPKFLVKQNIVLVTLNYRVGPYGFMCLDNEKVPGNQGLKDQLAALRWVKENIESFGGDVNNVTLAGQSAGSVSVDLHLLSEQELLFNKVILQSGTGLSPWVMTEPDLEAPLKISERLGFDTDDVNEALSFLSDVDPKTVVTTASELNLEFTPCVEKKFDGVESFIADDPINVKAVKAKFVKIIIGTIFDELVYIYHDADIENDIGNLFETNLVKNFNFEENDLKAMEETVRHFYIGDEKINNDIRKGIIDFDSDFLFQHPTERSIKKYFEGGASNIYRYFFTYEGGRNALKRRLNITMGGACHGDELGYMFDMTDLSEEPGLEDQKMIDRLTTLWTNFVKYGDPTPNTSELLPFKWTPVTKDTMDYLALDHELSMANRPLRERYAFWELFYRFNSHMQKGYREL